MLVRQEAASAAVQSQAETLLPALRAMRDQRRQKRQRARQQRAHGGHTSSAPERDQAQRQSPGDQELVERLR
jgi:hypothetical protein